MLWRLVARRKREKMLGDTVRCPDVLCPERSRVMCPPPVECDMLTSDQSIRVPDKSYTDYQPSGDAGECGTEDHKPGTECQDCDTDEEAELRECSSIFYAIWILHGGNS